MSPRSTTYSPFLSGRQLFGGLVPSSLFLSFVISRPWQVWHSFVEHMVYSALFFIFFITVVHAANDWTKPCLSGVCSFDLPASAGSSSGTVKIWGSKDGITDITTAAGWEILGCDPNALAQDIRLVCVDEAVGCTHLFKGYGAVGKIVRLPSNCGKSAFARVARAWIPEDQSIPSHIASRMVRRNGEPQPQVNALRFDTDFDAVDSSKTGAVKFAIQGANVPGLKGDIDTSTVGPQLNSRVYANRGLFNFVRNAIDSISELTEFDIDKTKTIQPLNFSTAFNVFNQKITCPPHVTASLKVDVEAKAEVVVAMGVAASGTIIPPVIDDFSVIASMNAEIGGSIELRANASGKLDSGKITIYEIGIPHLTFPGILTVGPTFEVGTRATASLDIVADVKVGLNYRVNKAEFVFPPDSKRAKAAGNKNAFKFDDTPLKISATPSVNALGTVSAHIIPSLNLKVSALGGLAKAGVFLELDASANMALSLEASGKGILDIPVSIPTIPSTVPLPAVTSKPILPGTSTQVDDINSTPTEAPITSVKALPPDGTGNGPTKATMSDYSSSTALDSTSVTLTKDLGMETATPSAVHSAVSTPETGALSTSSATSAATSTKTSIVIRPTYTGTATSATPKFCKVRTRSSPSAGVRIKKRRVIPRERIAEGSFGGCFDVGAGLDVNVGADTNFFGLFGKHTKLNLFSKKFHIFQKCFGNKAKKSFPGFSRRSLPTKLVTRNLVCPASKTGNIFSMADQTIRAAAIKVLS